MPNWLILVLLAIVFAVTAGWLSRRFLDTQVGWVRATVIALIVFIMSLPLIGWFLQQADVIRGDGTLMVVGPLVLAFFALIVGWMFAAVVIVVVTFEFLWPSHGVRNPVIVVRDAFRRRDRARRYAQILAIASRHGLGAYQSRHSGGMKELSAALVGALNDAGVTFVKLGQVLSSREDVLPRELIDGLSTLQMDSTPITWDEARGAIETELGRPVDEVFASIDAVPLAAASVAQVHTAQLRSGEHVVIKIQRPNAREQVTTDLDIIERLAADAQRRTDWGKDYGISALAAEFSRALNEELDYRVEVANTELLRGAIKKSHSMPLRIPQVHPEFSTRRMIVQQRIRGVPFGRLPARSVPTHDARALADGILDSVFEQITLRGVFHADLHPGNLILDDDGVVALIDFGAVGIVEHSLRRLIVPLLVAIANDDDIGATDVILMICAPEPEAIDQAALQRDVGAMLTRVHNSLKAENLFHMLLDTLRRNRLSIPPALLLVFRTLISLEGTLRRLVPDYDMVGRALERAPHFALQMLTPRSAMLTAQTQLTLTAEALRRLPRRWENVTRALEGGTFSVRLRTFEGTGERRWIESQLGVVTATFVGIALLASGVALAVSSGGPMITADVTMLPFLGSAVGLGGLLLLVRSLRTALRRRGGN